MKRKGLITVLTALCLLFLQNETSYSQNKNKIDISKKISIELPDNYVTKESKSLIINAENKNNGNIFLLATLEVHDFSPLKVMDKMDTLCFKLTDAKLLKTEEDKFYRLDEDYVYKYYNKGKSKILTYTFYTSEPYCMLFTYENDKDLAEINEIIDSISIRRTFWDKLWNCMRFELIFCLLILLPIALPVFAEDQGYNVTLFSIISLIIFIGLGFIFYPSYGLFFIIVIPSIPLIGYNIYNRI